MREIPADVMKTARETFEQFRDAFYIGQSQEDVELSKNAGIECIARAIMDERDRFMTEFEGAADAGIDAAIMAERERCEKIVRCGCEDPYCVLDNAADRIRDGDNP